MLESIKSNIGQKFIKFAVIGGISTIINYLIFMVLLSIGTQYLLASATGYISGVIFSFIFNKKITFKSDRKARKEVIKYFAVYLLSLFLGLSLLRFFVEIMKIIPAISNIFTIAFTTLTNFFGCEFFVFRKFKLPKIFKSRLFVTVLILKIVLSFLFGSDFIVKGTIPFVNYFVESSLKNPYNYFFSIGALKAFPYPPVMLFIISIFRIFASFLFTSDWNLITPVHLFVYRLPLLFGDLLIFYILSVILRTKEKLVTLLYWCSPILIYITYFHGQLDVLPIALLMVFIYCIYKNKFLLASCFLGLSIATKTHIVLVFPLYFIYLWKQRLTINRILNNIGTTILIYLLMLVPFAFSKGFYNLVFMAEEQFRIFNLFILLSAGNVKIFIIPAIFLILFLAISTLKGMNKDLFMMVITLIYTILVIFISPMPGWYYWSIPFIVFFIIKEGRLGHYITYGLLNVFYLLYFLFHKNSDIFQSFQVVSQTIASFPNPYQLLALLNINPELISNIFITLLTSTLILIVYWIYNVGVKNNLKYNLIETPFIMGIGGDSSSGKTTLTNMINALTGELNLTVVSGDDVHKWERGHKSWADTTHLDPKANLLYMNFRHAINLYNGKKVRRRKYDHKTGKFTKPKKIYAKRFIVFEGLHQFVSSGMRDIYDLKIFMDIDESLRAFWKLQRDMKKRSYTKKQVNEQLSKRKQDSQRYIRPQAKFADILIRYVPKSKLKEISKKPDFNIEVKMRDYINIESLSGLLESHNTIQFSYTFEPETFHISCRFDGELDKKEISKIAFKVVPNLRELLNNFDPDWYANKNGILQIILLMYIDEKLRKKNGS